MNEFVIKDNEIMIFTDFNNTLVDFENEYNSAIGMYAYERSLGNRGIKSRISHALLDLEQQTGLVPVICVVTNASVNAIDSNGSFGIAEDLYMTFFNHNNLTAERAKEVYESSCEKYFRYLIYKENDVFFRINPMANSLEGLFEMIPFGEDALSIKYAQKFKKRESVERMLSLIDPDKTKMKHVIFAGDSIEDDYPMKLATTAEGACKIFIRPGKIQKIKPSVMYEFCKAKGLVFNGVHPRTGKRIKCFDESTIQFLSDEEQAQLRNFDDGDYVVLTNKNSRGFVEGIYKAIEIITGRESNGVQKQ